MLVELTLGAVAVDILLHTLNLLRRPAPPIVHVDGPPQVEQPIPVYQPAPRVVKVEHLPCASHESINLPPPGGF